MVTEDRLDVILHKAPLREKFDTYGTGWAYLVSTQDGYKDDEFEHCTHVGISYLLASSYSLLQCSGWPSIRGKRCL